MDIKNFVLKSITAINVFILFFFACLLDSVSWLPFIICLTSAAWLILYIIANIERFTDGE